MNTQETTTVTLRVNAGQATQEIEKLRERLNKLNADKKAAENIGNMARVEDIQKDIDKVTNDLNRMLSRTERVRQALTQIDRATPRELRRTLRLINEELNSGAVERGSKEWDELTAAARTVNAELRQVREEMKAAKTELAEPPGGGGDGDNWLTRLGKNWVGVTTIFDQVTGWIDSARAKMEGYVTDYAEMAEHMSQVTKYTGLQADDVRELNEAFKQMDTRTPREKLNDLAGDAGRLGITSKQQILEFVDAANQINVALGEDLGEDAVKNSTHAGGAHPEPQRVRRCAPPVCFRWRITPPYALSDVLRGVRRDRRTQR